MAKLCSCYILCPLIEKGLVGVSEDSSPGCVIITLGKNMVIRYKLSDQNQVGSWSSRDRLTGPVTYDPKESRYVAIFNQSILRLWSENEPDLNKVKKFKFVQPIHLILPCSASSESVVVFKNGAVCSLTHAISGHTNTFKPNLTEDFQLENCWLLNIEGKSCVAMVANKAKGKTIFQLVMIGSGKLLWRLILNRGNDVKLLSRCVVRKGGDASLATLWSDGRLWSLPITISVPECDGMGTQLYMLTTVSTKHPVAMAQLSENHIALYGAEPNEEGAVLFVLNLKFLLVQARQHFKLFANTPQLWVQGDKLLVIVGTTLTVVPYTLETEQLLALVGSLKNKPTASKAGSNDIVAVTETVVWTEKEDKDTNSKSDCSEMPEHLKTIAEQGFSQALLCEATLPRILESKNMDDLVWVIRNFSDFPEVELVRLLLFCLEEPAQTFKTLTKNRKNEGSSNLDKIDYGAICKKDESMAGNWVPGRWKFLHILLSVRFTERVIIPYLRGSLSLPQCLELIERIVRLMSSLQDTNQIRTVLRWVTALLDSHQQQIVLAGKQEAGPSLFVLRDFLDKKMEYMNDLRSLHPLLDQLVNNKLRKSVKPLGNSFYSVEILSLY